MRAAGAGESGDDGGGASGPRVVGTNDRRDSGSAGGGMYSGIGVALAEAADDARGDAIRGGVVSAGMVVERRVVDAPGPADRAGGGVGRAGGAFGVAMTRRSSVCASRCSSRRRS
jgi:hypothetical protein